MHSQQSAPPSRQLELTVRPPLNSSSRASQQPSMHHGASLSDAAGGMAGSTSEVRHSSIGMLTSSQCILMLAGDTMHTSPPLWGQHLLSSYGSIAVPAGAQKHHKDDRDYVDRIGHA